MNKGNNFRHRIFYTTTILFHYVQSLFLLVLIICIVYLFSTITSYVCHCTETEYVRECFSTYIVIIIIIYLIVAETLGMEGESVGRSLERKPSWLDVDPATYGRSPSPEDAKRRAFTK